jgi:hypothetical protein
LLIAFTQDLQQAMVKATPVSRKNLIKNFLIKVCGVSSEWS